MATEIEEPKAHSPEQQRVINELALDIAAVQGRIREAEQLVTNTESAAKAANKLLKSRYGELSDLAGLMSDALDGNFQQRLPFPNGEESKPGEPPIDEAGKQPISALIEFGITENMAETLVELGEVGTVCQLEKLIATNPVWWQDIKGFGEKKVDKLSDAIVAFRAKWPVPVAEEVGQEQSVEEVATGPIEGNAETIVDGQQSGRDL